MKVELISHKTDVQDIPPLQGPVKAGIQMTSAQALKNGALLLQKQSRTQKE